MKVWSSCLLAMVVSQLGFGAPTHAKDVSPSKVLRAAEKERGTGSGYNWGPQSQSGSSAEADQSLAPYFHVEGDGATEALPLKSTRADIDIVGVIARVKVRQRFENTGKSPIHATYVFPGSTRAAVHGMRMRIGERTLEAKIDEREKARQTYEQAKQKGQRASLLEQQRPNVFTMNVANIAPGDVIDVELEYTELLVPETGTYELVYPVVVGPRYGGGVDAKSNAWIANPYLKEGEKETYAFDVKVNLVSGMPVRELTSPSHGVDVKYTSMNQASVVLKPGEKGGNRDFVLRYKLSGDAIETGLLIHRGKDENFFTWMMEPPAQTRANIIPPREYVFLLDVSGSMHGFPLDTAKELMRNLFAQLRPTDTFNISLFSGASYVLFPKGSIAATSSNLQSAMARIEQERGGGGTELIGGLKSVYAIPKKDDGVARSVVVVTDGYVGVEAEAFQLIRDNLQAANVFSFGIGSSVNRGLIEGMARAGQGSPFVVLKPAEAKEVAGKLQKMIEKPVLSNVEVKAHGFDAYEVAPDKLPSLTSERPLIVYGKFRGQPKGRIEVTGMTGEGRFSRSIELSKATESPSNEALKWLWARKWVETLQDEHSLRNLPALKDAITQLGLRYSLLTQFTSFVAVDSEIANPKGQGADVSQPLPLPEGVSGAAVGGRGAAMMRSMGASGAMPAAAPRPMVAQDSVLEAESYSPMKSMSAEKKREEAKGKDDKSADRRTSASDEVWLTVKDWYGKNACAPGRAVVEVVFDAQGKVKEVRSKELTAECRASLEKLLKSKTFRGVSANAKFAFTMQR